ncbi:uncharacterized protein EKO05_0003654 [Ascochyta rabiei]|uniref:uncharacterized protein n=1 Tax=Didymella rabiei TaxID=5454 RepID=UPI0019001B73|nr:uncharacterized protein EKO05_0003654 [Ascochyta rabiei]UPX13128.1 hypothetical protein EKO05_0003654 [Ascochyta rabiei]
MAAQMRLHGSCSCGRFRHAVDLPSQQTERAELRYDNSSASRQHSASPLTLWLRVPLPWYTSATFAQFPDETHSSIQRTFVSPFTPTTSNKFCGYCGTQLSSWNERTRDDAHHICLPVGSLLDEDQELLNTLGFFGDSSDEETSVAAPARTNPTRTVVRSEPQVRGAPWFEEIVRNTRLGRFRQQRGGHSDNGVQVEWEVAEWTEGDDDGDGDVGDSGSATPSKRKIGDLEVEDSDMRSA